MSTPPTDSKSMKHRDFKPCQICGKGVMHAGSPLFMRVTVERLGVDRRAVERAHGNAIVEAQARAFIETTM